MYCLLFVLVPLVDMTLLLHVADWLGAWETLALVIVTGIIGATIAKHQGWMALTAVQNDLHAGRLPTDNLLSGMLVLIGGAFLLTPGLLTDGVGFLLMAPPVRRAIAKMLKARLSRHVHVHVGMPFGPAASAPPPAGEMREAEARIVEEDDDDQTIA